MAGIFPAALPLLQSHLDGVKDKVEMIDNNTVELSDLIQRLAAEQVAVVRNLLKLDSSISLKHYHLFSTEPPMLTHWTNRWVRAFIIYSNNVIQNS